MEIDDRGTWDGMMVLQDVCVVMNSVAIHPRPSGIQNKLSSGNRNRANI